MTGGATGPILTMWQLTLGWYGDRLAPDWEPHPIEYLQGLLDDVGLTGPFWQLR